MSGTKLGPGVPGWLAAAIVGLLIGGVGGYYGAHWNDSPAGGGTRPGGGGAPGGGGPGGGMMGGGMGGGMMGGGGGAQAHPQAAALVRTVSSLAVLERARGNELTAEQRTQLAKAVTSLAEGGTLTEADCEARIKEINGILTPMQATTIEELLPRPGGGRGGGGGAPARGTAPPGGGAMAGGAPPGGANTPGANSPGRMQPRMSSPAAMGAPGGMGGGMGGGMMGGMGGGGIDYEQPFKEGRGRDRLEELLASLKR